MSIFPNFNTHTLRTSRFKQPAGYSDLASAYGSPQPGLSHAQTATHFDYSGANNVSSHKDIRNYAEQTLGSDNALIQAVKLPQDEDVNEWYAVHCVDFYNQINMLYGAITEFCSPVTCPRMIATEEYEYLWQETGKKPVSLPACEYIENLMNWVQGFFDNDNIFPSKIGAPFPQQFPVLMKTIFKRIFRIYAHIYCHHFHEITELGLQSHLNTSLKHFVLFANEFQLVSQKDYGPLEDLVETMLKQ